MASVKIAPYKSKTLKDGSHPIMLIVSINYKRKYISMDRRIHAKYWDFKHGSVNDKYPRGYMQDDIRYKKGNLKDYLSSRLSTAVNVIDELNKGTREYGIEEFMSNYKRKLKKGITVFKYIEDVISDMTDRDKIGNAAIYSTALNSFKRYRKDKDLNFIDLNNKMFNSFADYHKRNGAKGNTVSVYLRTLRAIFNRAIQDGYLDSNPVGNKLVITLTEPTRNYPLRRDDLVKMVRLDLHDDKLILARDVFLLMFYLGGMSFSDLCELSYDRIYNDVITYRRRKIRETKKKRDVRVPISKEAKIFLEKYMNPHARQNDYILPILSRDIHQTETQILNRIRKVRTQINKNLKILGGMIGNEVKLTTKIARNSYANMLLHKDINIKTIQEALGHANLTTTMIYLADMDNRAIAEANDDLLGLEGEGRSISIQPDQHQKRKAE